MASIYPATLIINSWLLLKANFRLHKATVRPTGFRANFAALFILNFWLREFPLSAVANSFESQCQSKGANAIFLQNLSFLLKQ